MGDSGSLSNAHARAHAPAHAQAQAHAPARMTAASASPAGAASSAGSTSSGLASSSQTSCTPNMQQLPAPAPAPAHSSAEVGDQLGQQTPQLLVLEITVAGVTDDVLVHYGDRPRELAIAFARKHNLGSSSSSSTVDKIARHVEQCLASFLKSSPAERYVTGVRV